MQVFWRRNPRICMRRNPLKDAYPIPENACEREVVEGLACESSRDGGVVCKKTGTIWWKAKIWNDLVVLTYSGLFAMN